MKGVSPTFLAAFEAHRAGRVAEAERGYRAVLKSEPRNADAWHLMGLIAQHNRDLPTAVDYIKKALKLSGPNASFLVNLGVIYVDLGRSADAVKALKQALKLTPGDFTARFALGNALKSLGRAEDALEHYRQAASLDPRHAGVQNNMGSVFQTLGRLTEAAQCFRQAIALQPDHARAHYNLGVVLKDAGKLTDAAESLRAALRYAPTLAEAHVNLGVVLHDLGDFEQAVTSARTAIALNPKDAAAFNNLGAALRDAGRLDEAMEVYNAALALRPDLAEARHNQGVALEYSGQRDQALEHFQHAQRLNPALIEAEMNAALLMLMRGDFKAGWEAYECRWRRDVPGLGLRTFPYPTWKGERAPGDIVVWGEQGVGDRILYSGMIPDLMAQGHGVVMETDPRLHALFERSFPGIVMVPKQEPPHPATSGPGIRWHTALAGLGQYLRPDAASFPKKAAYLRADAAKVAQYRDLLGRDGRKPVVGISWTSRAPRIGHHKTLDLRQWAPILQTPGVRFVDLQYGDTTTERAALRAELGVEITHIEGLDLRDDLDGLAALISACDLVISVSNTTVHLAAALGKPTLIMVPAAAGNLWYWMRDTSHTPWYVTATIFRQKTLGEWSDTIQEVKKTLDSHLDSRAAVTAN
jgi:tetratricopeptide (TPR) repeat protein